MKSYIEMVKTKFNRRPKLIRSDRGREYLSQDLIDYLKKNGVKTQTTAPYTPQQNGKAERKNRYLLEMARTMILESGLEKKYWGEAVNTANYLQNRLPSRATEKTPYELWESRKPDLGHIHVFGSAAYAHVPKQSRTKLDPKAKKLTFVGYETGSKAFRLLDTKTNKITISRDVTFVDECNVREKIGAEIGSGREESNVDEKADEESDESTSSTITISSDDASDTSSSGESTITVIDRYDADYEHNANDPDATMYTDTDYDEAHDTIGELRVSSRITKGKIPERYGNFANTIRIMEPKTYEEAISSPEKEKWTQAMEEEINSLLANDTWELVDLPEDRKAVGCKWVYKVKKTENEELKYKARVVAKGFSQKFGEDYDEVFAPVVKPTTVKILLTLAGIRNYVIRQYDVKTAFLNGDIEETIFMSQPKGYIRLGQKEKVCKLKRSLYGLKQAARSWNERMKSDLKSLGFKQSKRDPCLFFKTKPYVIYFILYVDDYMMASETLKAIDEAEKSLRELFTITSLGEPKFFLGLNLSRDNDGFFYMDQSNYINKILIDTNMENAKPSAKVIDPGIMKEAGNSPEMEDKGRYQSLIGKLLYLGVNTRPDILTSVCILSQFNTQPTERHWTEAKRIVRYLKGTINLQLKLGSNKRKKSDNKLLAYSDADWAENRKDRKSNSGYVLQLCDSTVSWYSRKQTCVATSSTEAEYVAMFEACKEIVWTRKLLKDFGEPQNVPTMLYEDNQSALKILENPGMSDRTKHVDTKFHYSKWCMEKRRVHFEYCPTNSMVADLMTKPLGPNRTKELREAIGLRDWAIK
jgi:hypothetical protein